MRWKYFSNNLGWEYEFCTWVRAPMLTLSNAKSDTKLGEVHWTAPTKMWQSTIRRSESMEVKLCSKVSSKLSQGHVGTVGNRWGIEFFFLCLHIIFIILVMWAWLVRSTFIANSTRFFQRYTLFIKLIYGLYLAISTRIVLSSNLATHRCLSCLLFNSRLELIFSWAILEKLQ